MSVFEPSRDHLLLVKGLGVCLALGLLAAPALAESPPESTAEEPLEVAALFDPPAFRPGADVAGEGTLSGRVSCDRSPLGAVRVYAYQLADLTLSKVTTDRFGHFVFEALPAGLYKVIAHKSGFVPAVVLVTRATADAYQYLDLELAEDSSETVPEDSDFWTIRSRIPADVLREIQLAESARLQETAPTAPSFQAEMQALSGIEDFADLGEALLTGGAVDLQGQLGQLEVALRGSFRQLGGVPQPMQDLSSVGATSSSLAVGVADANSEIRVSSQHFEHVARSPVDVERYGVQWRQQIGRGESTFAAQYTTENNFYRDRQLIPVGIPEASTTWTVSGAYETRVTERNSLRSGLQFRQMEGSYAFDSRGAIPSDRLELFGVGDFELQPALMVQYGLFTTLSDGSLSFSPHAGLVLELGEHWQAEVAARQRFENRGPEFLPQFMPAYYSGASSCGTAEEYCYQVGLTRRSGESDSVSVGALHREFSETLRVYFSEDFFDHLESLFFVPGDELPEVHVGWTRQLGPNLTARFESSVAEGGGGIFRAADAHTYRNQVGYLVTAVDTHFRPTATGVLVAFHRMEQRLEPTGLEGAATPELDMDRLRILLRQDLQGLLGLAQDWTLSFDVQLSRGAVPYTDADPDEIRKRFVGGLAVRF